MTAPKKPEMTNADLISKYRPVGIKAVVAAALHLKAKPLPAKAATSTI
ncbi:hypothetical protein IFT84_00975 [Rhizobium sp. CFBP 8762]|nr:hypothetical protein [Rhizobium sp. CFBP 8762]MBD8553090.1 hypothetical protein [Rhizobium sp. CFBP 8762]